MRFGTRELLTTTAVLEIAVGVAMAAVPAHLVPILLGLPLEGFAGTLVARLAGAALVSFGVACWAGRGDPHGRVTQGILAATLLYNIAAAVLLVWARFGLRLPGLGMLPTAVMHAVLAGWCVARLRAASPKVRE